MRITDQTPDLLRIVGRKKNPFVRSIVAGGLFFTVPCLILIVLSPTRQNIGTVVPFLALIWLILGLAYAATGGLSGPPVAVFDAKTRQANFGGGSASLDRIRSVRGRSQGLVVDFDDGESTEFFSDSTPAETSIAANAINEFLVRQRVNSVVESGDGLVQDDFEETEDLDANVEYDDYQRRLTAAERWASQWNAIAQAGRRCVFCDARPGDSAPVEIDLSHQEFPLSRKAYVPRCRPCARIHYSHGRLPLILAAFALPATFVFCIVVVSEHRNAGVAFGAAFVALMLAVPISVLAIGRFLTRPLWFGSKPIDAWEEQQDLVSGRREDWTIRMSHSSRRTS